MIHARKDYNRRIQDSEEIIPGDEPVFLLRGQDVFAATLLDIYAMLVEHCSSPDENIVRNTRAHAAEMRRWQDKKKKLPDMNAADSVY